MLSFKFPVQTAFAFIPFKLSKYAYAIAPPYASISTFPLPDGLQQRAARGRAADSVAYDKGTAAQDAATALCHLAEQPGGDGCPVEGAGT